MAIKLNPSKKCSVPEKQGIVLKVIHCLSIKLDCYDWIQIAKVTKRQPGEQISNLEQNDCLKVGRLVYELKHEGMSIDSLNQ